MYGTEKIDSDLAWRLPVWLQSVAAGLVVFFSLFCPETPRWVCDPDLGACCLPVIRDCLFGNLWYKV